MSENSVSFSEFPSYTREEWIDKVEKDLKGRSLSELDWQLEANWSMSPLWHDPTTAPAPILRGRSSNNWAIGAIVSTPDTEGASTEALEALTGGCNAPLFQLYSGEQTDLHRLLAGIEARFVSLHFELSEGSSRAFWTQLEAWAQAQNLDAQDLRGSIATTPTPTLASALLADWPGMRSVEVDARSLFQMNRSPVEELARCLHSAVARIGQLENDGLEPRQINDQLFFRLAIGRRYFLDMAKLRALRILWANVLGAYGLPEASLPPVHAYVQLDPNASMEDNMIRSGTQAMAAAIGGADCIFVPPASRQAEKHAFSQRIARNVQHLLQLESKLDHVLDPAAGSYFLERLTDELSTRAWQQFVALRKA